MSSFAQAEAAINAWFADIEQIAVGVARGISVELFNKLLDNSPQFSGDFAANWNYSINVVDKTFRPLESIPGAGAVPFGRAEEGHIPRYALNDYGHRSQGDPEAIEEGKRRNAGKERRLVKLGQTVFISNTSAHDELYAMLIEENKIKFNPGNRGETGKRSMREVAGKYGVAISRPEALELMSKMIGV